MQVRIVKMRSGGVEIDRRALRDVAGTRGHLVIVDTTDQGMHRPCKVARLVQGELLRAELKDVTLIWANDGRMTLAGFEQVTNDAGQTVDYRQSWLVTLDSGPTMIELSKQKVSPNP